MLMSGYGCGDGETLFDDSTYDMVDCHAGAVAALVVMVVLSLIHI